MVAGSPKFETGQEGADWNLHPCWHNRMMRMKDSQDGTRAKRGRCTHSARLGGRFWIWISFGLSCFLGQMQNAHVAPLRTMPVWLISSYKQSSIIFNSSNMWWWNASPDLPFGWLTWSESPSLFWELQPYWSPILRHPVERSFPGVSGTLLSEFGESIPWHSLYSLVTNLQFCFGWTTVCLSTEEKLEGLCHEFKQPWQPWPLKTNSCTVEGILAN